MSRSEFLAAANAIGASLCRDAVWAGGRCTWLGDSMEFVDNRWQVVHRAFGPDLYAGSSGVGLLLGRLFAFTGEPVFRATAEAAFRHAFSRLADIPLPSRAGFYSGLPGIAYAAVATGECLSRPWLLEQGLATAEALKADDPAGQGIDVLSGSAGAIAPLLRLAKRYDHPVLREIANLHGQRLLAIARVEDDIWHWDTTGGQAKQGLTGFSHGAAGIGWALLELSAVTNDPAARAGAEGAFRYERACFNADHQNWPDLRSLYDPTLANGASEPAYMVAWCHGAPGIALSRLRAFELTGDATYRVEVEAAIGATSKSLSHAAAVAGGNFSLCHGFGGNSEPLLIAANILGEPAYRAVAEEVAAAGLDTYRTPRLPWPCGVIGGGETPGLLLGVAGIAYYFLRLHSPAVPSILLPEV